jgi:Protein of unknown function (DUF3352)
LNFEFKKWFGNGNKLGVDSFVPEMVMKSRSFFSALALAVIALLTLGAVGAYGLAANSALAGGNRSTPAAAMFISQRSPLVTTLLGNPDRLTASSFANTPPTQRRALQAEIKRIQATLLTDTHLDYSRDIQPWAGSEITVALTAADVDRDSSNGQQPGYLVAIAIDNPEQAREALEKFWQKRAAKGAKLVFEQFASVPIVHAPSTLASAMVGDRFVLFANDSKVLRDAINNAQVTDQNLSQSKDYQEAIASLPPEALGFAFANLPRKNGVDHLAMTFKLAPQGLLADTALLTKTAKPSRPTLSAPVDALKWIPENSLAMAGGKNVQQVWTQLESSLTDYGMTESLQKLQEEWGVNLAEDVLSWMPGDYAVGLLAGTRQPDWVFVTKQSAETTDGLEKLSAIAQKQGVSIGSVPLGEAQIVAWTKLQTTPKNRTDLVSIEAKVEGVHTTINGYEIFATSLEAMEQAMQTEGRRDLGQVAGLESRNNGYLSVEGSALRSGLGRLAVGRALLGSAIAPRAKPLLDRVESLTVSNYGSDTKGSRNGVLIQFNPQP